MEVDTSTGVVRHELLEAVRSGHLLQLGGLLSDVGDVNALDSNGKMLLITAMEDGEMIEAEESSPKFR